MRCLPQQSVHILQATAHHQHTSVHLDTTTLCHSATVPHHTTNLPAPTWESNWSLVHVVQYEATVILICMTQGPLMRSQTTQSAHHTSIGAHCTTYPGATVTPTCIDSSAFGFLGTALFVVHIRLPHTSSNNLFWVQNIKCETVMMHVYYRCNGIDIKLRFQLLPILPYVMTSIDMGFYHACRISNMGCPVHVRVHTTHFTPSEYPSSFVMMLWWYLLYVLQSEECKQASIKANTQNHIV